MSYITTVQSKSPIGFAYLNELSGDVIVNYGTDPGQGTYYPDAVKGQPSPIESDASSRSVGNRVGTLPVPAPVNGLSFGGWAYYSPTLTAAVICRNGQVGVANSNMIVIDSSGLALARLNPTGNPGDVFDLSYALPVPNQFYRFMLVRNGIHVEFRINAVVQDESDGFISGAITNTAYINGDGTDTWRLGVNGPTGNLFAGFRTVALEIYDYPLAVADDLEIYEAAFNTLSLTGVSNVLSSAVLYSDLEPDPVNFPFRHNWTDSLIERISFRAARSNSVKGYESANSLRPKPRRELELQQVLRDDAERSSFRAKLNANQHRKWFIPILEDREQLTAPLSAGATLLPATTQYRDYEVGSYAELRQLSVTGEVTKSEQVLITDLDPFTTNPTTLSYDAYLSSISPARRGLVEAQISPRGHTGTVEDMSLVIRLLAEDEEVTPNRITPWTPTLTYKSHEVFDPAVWQSNDWSELRDHSVERERSDIDFDTGTFAVESDTVGASESFGYRMTLEGRDKHAALLGWFYARAGSINYLWVPTMQADFSPVSAVSDEITVQGHNYFDNYAGSEYRRDLAFIYFDNTMEFRRIEGVTLDGANEVLDLNTSAPTFTNLRTVSYLRFCRLDGDTLEIARVTDTKAQFAWGFREILSSPA